MKEEFEKFIQSNSSDGGFLQSEEWRKFQEAVGRKTFNISIPHPSPLPQAGEGEFDFWANIIEHQLPVAGKYFYIPRGPIIRISNFKLQISNQIQNPNDQIKKNILELIELAKKNKAGWIRIEPENEEMLNLIQKNITKVEPFYVQGSTLESYKIVKAPHDMQPKEILVMDITKSEEELLAEMKPKTRYNIKLSQKHGVSVKVISNFKLQISNQAQNPNDQNKLDSGSGAGMANKYIEEFIRLVKITTKRDKITPHPENYYRKMFEAIPGDILKLYAAEYQNKVIAANLMIFFGKTATYLHGASDNKQRNLMAPYLLQWQAIKDAKKTGCEKYDFGGIKSSGPTALDRNNLKRSDRYGSWSGITKFKLGFAPNIKPIEFPGCYDIIINPMKYKLYRITQKIKSFL